MKRLAGISAKTIAVSVLAIGIATTAAAKDSDKITRNLDLAGFDRIEISGVYEMNVAVGADYSIELSGPQDEMDWVEASVKNGVLILDQRDRERGEKRRRWHNSREGIDAVITLPSLIGVDVTGVVDGEISGIDSERFDIDISGVGDVDLDGECGTLDADVSGVGDLEAKDLQCRVVSVEVSGVGSASVYASEEVDAEVSGMGDIDVYGSPEKVRKENSMFADITIH